MSKRTEMEFQQMAEDLISEAEAVECSLHEFADGLESILHDVKERLELVRDELKGQKRGDEGEEDDTESDED